MFLTCWSATDRDLRALLIDGLHRGVVTVDEIVRYLEGVGPVPGKVRLRRLCEDLAGRQVESIFNDEVGAELARLGYPPDRSVRRISTPDGVGLRIDVALPTWQIAVEPVGDTFHRTREARRQDRRRHAAYAGTDWVQVPGDWRDWHLDRAHVLRSIDAAIVRQRRRGEVVGSAQVGHHGADRVALAGLQGVERCGDVREADRGGHRP